MTDTRHDHVRSETTGWRLSGIPLRTTGLVALGVVALIAVNWFVGAFAAHLALLQLETVSSERALLYRTTLEKALSKLGHLPLVISQEDSIAELLDTGDGLGDVRDYLSSTVVAADAAVIYVIDTNGKTVASSNWRKAESFEGRNYGFRPYFKDAIEGREGRFFAVGVTTNRSGYFISRPVYADEGAGRVLGVVVVKVELADLQASWREAGAPILVANEDGIIVAASQDRWLYRTLAPLTPEVHRRISANRTFTNQSLDELDIVKASTGKRHFLTIEGKDYLDIHAGLSQPPWIIHYLADLGTVTATRWVAMGFGLGGALFALVSFLYLREKQRKRALAREAAEARRIHVINEKLALEIEERKAAEAQLQAAQQELVLASKMAALGRMSAAIAHEVNQPIAAIRTFTASGRLLLDRGRPDETRQTLQDISQVVDRLAKITGDLKTFARTTEEEKTAFHVKGTVLAVLKTFQAELDSLEIELDIGQLQPDLLALGSQHRAEQVVSNIVRNAVDAMTETSSDRRISISCTREDGSIALRIRDNGPGIEEAVLSQVFDPFVTTKPVGQGVGLGLAISFGLIEDMGGTIRARNVAGGGAEFSIRLQAANVPAEHMKAAE